MLRNPNGGSWLKWESEGAEIVLRCRCFRYFRWCRCFRYFRWCSDASHAVASDGVQIVRRTSGPGCTRRWYELQNISCTPVSSAPRLGTTENYERMALKEARKLWYNGHMVSTPVHSLQRPVGAYRNERWCVDYTMRGRDFPDTGPGSWFL